MIRELAKFFSELSDVVSDPVRATIVRRFCRLVTRQMIVKNPDLAEKWKTRDRAMFIADCHIKDGVIAGPDDLDVKVTDLSKFCDYWLSLSEFRRPDGEWTPLTADMDSLRVAFVHQLQELANRKLEEDA